MKIALTGATGLVGRFILNEALAAGDDVLALGRTAPGDASSFRDWSLDGPAPDLCGIDVLIHAALLHKPGRYRGGEGDDPDGFRRANVDGTARLFEAAARAGVTRILFLSSRAVYGPKPPGAPLSEDTACRPDTLYGQVKLEGERLLAESGVPGTSLRATGVYGAGWANKWRELFEAFARGDQTAPRVGSEVHGKDLAHAIRLLLDTPPAEAPPICNVSDVLLDRQDLLADWAGVTGQSGRLPERADASAFNEMTTDPLTALGWRPGGRDRLRDTLREIASEDT
ncbi:NAD-dependent epimerase/dehydratase family protein [Pelagovum pacificum]|uniref:NAD(P)-dependent oxidoreductase n=1 Tax=Pelagovum pacificum TaxID=2588711 RepID=A0A5C5GHJ9_9RHOB|nr:NAD(P)-dependent oxidoreductase [Pelagovum pacificum]QQA43154.1 NAD(P)-dependent oxidoreductase [Pelagovum pacificum]TNY33704.1 NAD(P)-dependent oxidoreductase [Pelagovum pacificum]